MEMESIFNEIGFKYIYSELNMINKEKIGEIFLNIFLQFSQKGENMTNIGNKNEIGRKEHSCVLY